MDGKTRAVKKHRRKVNIGAAIAGDMDCRGSEHLGEQIISAR